MSEPITDTAVAGEIDPAATETGGTYTPPATQAELDRIISDRVNRTKAQFKDYADLKAAKAELDQIRQANQSETEKQTETLNRWQTEAETWRNAAVSARVEALAAADFADASDALSALGDASRFLTAGGEIDSDAIRAELTDLLERKPHWRKQQDAAPSVPRPPSPNPAQGTSGTAAHAAPRDQFAAILQQPR